MNFKSPCYYVYQKKPYHCDAVKAAGGLLCVLHRGKPVSNGVVRAASGLYACLVYDRCRVITLVTDGAESQVINLIYRDSSDYKRTLDMLGQEYGVKLHNYDGKVISYARSISEKLRIGVEVQIIPPQNEDDCIICPECGVLNHKDSGLPFCQECGAAL